ncbi:MAG: tail protein X [Wolbachia sp.]
MTIYYLTKEGEMLDLICWKHYGFTDGIVDTVSINYPYQ